MENKVKLKDIPKGKKLSYIMDYYWVHMLAAAAVVAVAWIMIANIRNYQEPLLELIMINTYKSEQEQEQVVRDFLQENGYEVFDTAVAVDTDIRFGVNAQSDAYSTNQLMTTTVAGEGDLYFWTGEEFEPYIEKGALEDLRNYLPEELLAKLEDRLYYTTLGDEVEAYPCGIDLKGNSWAKEHGYINGGLVGISRGVKNTEAAVKLLTYIVNMSL